MANPLINSGDAVLVVYNWISIITIGVDIVICFVTNDAWINVFPMTLVIKSL